MFQCVTYVQCTVDSERGGCVGLHFTYPQDKQRALEGAAAGEVKHVLADTFRVGDPENGGSLDSELESSLFEEHEDIEQEHVGTDQERLIRDGHALSNY